MRLIQSFLIACSMYSKIPVPTVQWDEKNMKYAMCFFPVVGLVTGALLWGVGTVLFEFGASPLLFAACMTLLPLVVTGGIHMDGFLDTVDALSSYGDREKKLEILKDPHAGAFAILGMGCYLVWSLGVWSEASQELLPVIALGFVLSRALSGFSVAAFTPAKESGLVYAFHSSAEKMTVKVTMLVCMAASGIGMWLLQPIPAAAALLGAGIVFWLYHRICSRVFGGITGDLAGYFLQLCELAILTMVVLVFRMIG